MKNYVSYEKSQRDRAIQDGKGLYSIDLMGAPSKKHPRKFNGRITLQGPVDADEYRKIMDFILAFMESREKQEASR